MAALSACRSSASCAWVQPGWWRSAWIRSISAVPTPSSRTVSRTSFSASRAIFVIFRWVMSCLPCLVERCIYIVVGATIIAQFWADASPLLFLPRAGFITEAGRGHAGWSGAAGRLDDSTVSRSIPIRRTGPRMAFLQSSGGLSFGCIQWSSTVLPVSGSGMPSRARMMAMRM